MKRRNFLRLSGGALAAGGLLYGGCTDNNLTGNLPIPEPSGPDLTRGIDFYLLKNAALTYRDFIASDPATLELQSTPWISRADILRFDSSSDILYLNRSTVGLLPDIFQEQISGSGIPFVVYADNAPCAIGGIIPGYSSWQAPGAPGILRITTPSFYAPDLLLLENFSALPGNKSQRLLQALDGMGVLHKGIECILGPISVFTSSGTSNVTYTVNFRNHDTDDLYVFCPEKMGGKRFHYFTNGPVFFNGSRNFWSEHKEVEPPSSNSDWPLEWFTRTRTGGILMIGMGISVGGYDAIPPGEHSCTFSFPSPNNIERSMRERPDVRIWIGTQKVQKQITLYQHDQNHLRDYPPGGGPS